MRTEIIHANDTLSAVVPENMAVAVVEVAAVVAVVAGVQGPAIVAVVAVAVVAAGAIYNDPRNDKL